MESVQFLTFGFLCQETCRVEKLNVNVVLCVFFKLTVIFICVTKIIKSFRNCNNYTERAWAHAVWSTISYCWSFLDIYNCKNVKDHNKRSNPKIFSILLFGNLVTSICDGTIPQKYYQIKRSNLLTELLFIFKIVPIKNWHFKIIIAKGIT